MDSGLRRSDKYITVNPYMDTSLFASGVSVLLATRINCIRIFGLC